MSKCERIDVRYGSKADENARASSVCCNPLADVPTNEAKRQLGAKSGRDDKAGRRWDFAVPYSFHRILGYRSFGESIFPTAERCLWHGGM